MSEHFQDYFLHVLIQLVVIIVAARIGAWLLAKLGQPQVVGEILVGLVLGPSVLGHSQIIGLAGGHPWLSLYTVRISNELDGLRTWRLSV